MDKSLLRQEAQEDHEPRFGMLETVRLYALERLTASGEEASVRRRHAAWCLDLAERFWEQAWDGTKLGGWLRRLEWEHDNLRAALAWLDQVEDSEGLIRLVGALWQLWFEHNHRAEGIGWLERALAGGGDASPAFRLRAVIGLCRFLERRGDHEQARIRHREWLDLARALGDRRKMAGAAHFLGLLAVNQGRYDEAAPLLEDALNKYGQLGDESGMNNSRYCLGVVAYGRGDHSAAAAYLEAVLASRVRAVDTFVLPPSLDALALVRCEQGDWAGAAALLAEAMALWQRRENQAGQAEWLTAAARLALCRGQGKQAARLYGAAEALGARLGSPLLVPPPNQHRRHVEELRAALGVDAFAAAWADGRALPLEQATDEALAATSAPPTAPDPAGDPPTASAPLTSREREVLRLVAEGRTDREIAAALFIGARTVEWHLTNAFHKLGVGTRAAAAAAALRRGLI